MQKVTFDTLPDVVTAILDKVSKIELLLTATARDSIPINSGEQWLSLDELINYLTGNPSKATIYAKTHNRQMPHKKFGSKLIFAKSEIDAYLQTLHRKTQSEIEKEANAFIQKNVKL